MPVPLDQATLTRVRDAFADVAPWAGEVPGGRVRNFAGILLPTDIHEAAPPDEPYQTTARRPSPSDGESFFEWYSTYQSILSARERYTMVSLGAHYGGPLVNAAYLLKAVRPMPFKLIGVEGDPHMCETVRQHFAENGIPMADHCLINAAVSGDNRPKLFPTTEIRTGSNHALHDPIRRERICNGIIEAGRADHVLRSIMRDMTLATEVTLPLSEEESVQCELEIVSAVTVSDVVAPHDVIDYLEIDIQWSEYFALPPALDLLDQKVRWIHLGTHGSDIHAIMVKLFDFHGWDILVDLTPNTEFIAPSGMFRTMDGVLSLRNPRLT